MKKTVFIKLRVLINSQFFSLTLISFVLLFTTSCKNFFNGDFIKDLNDSINYINMSYVEVSIVAPNSYTETIVPAADVYKTQYKRTDSISLKFVPKTGFQFIKWVGTPAENISFEDELSTTTSATIEKDDSPLTIEPLVYERPTVTFEPTNAVTQPKNVPISIKFSAPIEATEEDFEKIEITIDGLSIKEYYQDPPTFSEDKTTITYIPRRDKLMDVVTSVKIINVIVPETFYILQDGYEITLGQEANYSFKVNSETETKATISFNCPSEQGKLSYSSSKAYNLDEQISTTCIPNEQYTVTGWDIKYAGEPDSSVPKNIISVITSEDKKTITVTVLMGTDKEIVVSPIFDLVPKVTKYYPDSTTIVYSKDSVISVLFSTKVELNCLFTTANPFLNISITTDDEAIKSTNVKDYFYNPEAIFYENESELLIKPKTEKITELFQDKTTEKINVSIALTAITNSDGEQVFTNDLSFSYKIENTLQDTTPIEFVEKHDFKLFRTKADALKYMENPNATNTGNILISSVTSDTECEKFGVDEYNTSYPPSQERYNYFMENIFQATVEKTVWLYAKLTDKDYNNLQKIIITEQNMNHYGSPREEYSSVFTTNDKDCIEFDPVTNTYTFLAEYNVVTNTDCVLRLTFKAYDGSNKETKKMVDVLEIATNVSFDFLRTPPVIAANTLTEDITLYFCFPYGYSINSHAPYINTYGIFLIDLGAKSESEYNAGSQFNIKVDNISYSYDKVNYTKVDFTPNDYVIKEEYNGRSYIPCAKTKITRDCTRTLYVKYEYSDCLGIKGETIQKVPKNIDVLDADIDNNNLSISLFDAPDSDDSCYLFYSKDNSNLKAISSFSGKVFSKNVSNFISPLEDGVYNFYVFPWKTFYDGEDAFQIPDNADFDNVFEYINNKEELSQDFNYKDNTKSELYLIPVSGAVGNSFAPVYVGTGTTKPDPTVSASDVPSSFTLSKKSNGVNSATYSVTLNYPAGFSKNSNCVYFNELNNTTDNQKTVVSENTFNCKSGCNYEIKVIARDKNGNERASEPVTITLPSDNISPSWEWNESSFSNPDFAFNHFYITSIPTFNNDEPNNDTKIYYYIDDKETTSLEKFNNAFTEDLNNNKYCIYYHGEKGSWFHFLVKDVLGNYTIKSELLNFYFNDDYLGCKKKDSNNVNLCIPEEYDIPYYYSYFIRQKLTVSNGTCSWNNVEFKDVSWNADFNSGNDTRIYRRYKNGNIVENCFPLSTSSYPYFIRVAPTSDDFIGCDSGSLKYYCPKTITSGNTINLKTVMANGNECVVFADAPVFLHTLTSPEKLETVQDWEHYGLEVEMKYAESSFNFTLNLNNENYKYKYYTTIVHFADGTSKMLDVRQK